MHSQIDKFILQPNFWEAICKILRPLRLLHDCFNGACEGAVWIDPKYFRGFMVFAHHQREYIVVWKQRIGHVGIHIFSLFRALLWWGSASLMGLFHRCPLYGEQWIFRQKTCQFSRLSNHVGHIQCSTVCDIDEIPKRNHIRRWHRRNFVHRFVAKDEFSTGGNCS